MTGFALHLLRHGAPAMPGLLMGRTDGAPTCEGIAGCAAQAESLDFESLIASDLRRCRAAGEKIGRAAGLSLAIDPRWRELDFGDWDGRTARMIDREALGRFWDDPDANPPPGGECWSALVSRVSAAIADLAPVPTLVVTHGGAMRAALHILCGFEQRQTWAFDLPYASLLSLNVWPGERPSAQIARLCA
ncbi:histidine phosphatase family protein [Sphingopyxis sp. JAI128]|uniref:histidine phosphatase family protein n=1 Tax=Sphingopyxis sp. JAI128 TaxID=2723066 RepID=UPI00161CD1A7|nr:histidine phosphatase family protein [Sphingopyxis sp. JAI128]MBB6426639.1 alpha-ribazole phosphatase [Sphingopyxis sp. JAI128]